MPPFRPRSALLALTAATILLGACPTPTVAAPGFSVLLKGSNFASFTDQDMKLFLNTVETTVASQPDGVEVTFNSPDSGSTGRMSVVKSYTRETHACRDVGGDTTVCT